MVEPHTPLSRLVQSGQVTPVPPDEDAELYELAIDFLAAHRFEQYEVSNYAQPGYRSRHNSKYWRHDLYLGFGPSAHSFWAGSAARQLGQDHLPIEGCETLDKEDLLREEIMLGLRSDGVDISRLEQRYRFDIMAERGQELRDFVREQFVRLRNNKLSLTKRGYLVCDSICAALSS